MFKISRSIVLVSCMNVSLYYNTFEDGKILRVRTVRYEISELQLVNIVDYITYVCTRVAQKQWLE